MDAANFLSVVCRHRLWLGLGFGLALCCSSQSHWQWLSSVGAQTLTPLNSNSGLGVSLRSPVQTASIPPGPANDRRSVNYGRLPLRFEVNRGQAAAPVQFLARGSASTLLLTAQGATLGLSNASAGLDTSVAEKLRQARRSFLRMKLQRANPQPELRGLAELPGRTHYFTGAAAHAWHTQVPGYERVKYEAVYPGIDLVFYGQSQTLEYDFLVAPGADAGRIRLSFEGAQQIRINAQGELVLRLPDGEVRQRPPVVYQETAQGRVFIPARYQRFERDEIGFHLGAYDRTRTLCIDPVLEYSTYLGGISTDQAVAVAVDEQGNSYVAGFTASTDFPGPNGIQAAPGGSFDAFIAKLNPAGTAIVYAAYLGGSASDQATALSVDKTGAVYLAGTTFSSNFPVTVNALQRNLGGAQDGFAAKLDPTGSALVFSTYLGGSFSEIVNGLVADASGEATLVGATNSATFFGQARNGRLVYRSVAGANQWVAQDQGLNANFVYQLAPAAGSSSTVYAATAAGVFKSTDRGANWSATALTQPVFTVTVDPTKPETVYAGSLGQVFKSTDGGASFITADISTLIVPQILALVVDPRTPTTLYASTQRGAYKSTNGGLNWVSINVGLTSAFNSNLLRVNHLVLQPIDSQILYAATQNGVYKSSNGGATWTVTGFTNNSIEVFAVVLDPQAPETLLLSTSGVYGGVLKSTDGAASWRPSGQGISYTFGGSTGTPSVHRLAADPVQRGVFYASSNSGGIFKTSNGGATWTLNANGLTNFITTSLVTDGGGSVYAATNPGADAFLLKLNAAGTALRYSRLLGGAENDEGRALALDAAGNVYVTGVTFSPNFPTVRALQDKLRGFSDFFLSSDAFLTKLSANGSEILYSTYLGGNFTEQGRAVVVDAQGRPSLLGQTSSTDFPTTAAAWKPVKTDFGSDLFVTRFNASGTALEMSTYLGGSQEDMPAALALDSSGNAYIAGTTSSPDFPVVNTLYASTTISSNTREVFLSRLSASGGLLSFSTFLGGTRDEIAAGLALDAQRNLYLTGATNSFDFPTLNALRPSASAVDAFLVKLAARADLAVTSAASANPVQFGKPLTFTLTVTNQGPDDAQNVTLNAALPVGLSNVNVVTRGGGTCNGNSALQCALGDLAVGAVIEIIITATSPNAGSLRQTVSVASTTSDPQSENNSATQTINLTERPSLAGVVTRASGGNASGGLAGVNLSLSGGGTQTKISDANGRFQFAELAAGDNYLVTASAPGFVVRPLSLTFNNLQADQTANFTAHACTYALQNYAAMLPTNGGSGSVTLTRSDTLCPYEARSNVPWLTLNNGVSNNDLTVTYTYTAAATKAPRQGTLTIAGRTFTVQQEFEPCAVPAWALATGLPLNGNAQDLAVGDFNGDQLSDVVVPNTPVAGAVTWLPGDGQGQLGTPVQFDFGLTQAVSGLSVGDFNGDGRSDVAGTTDGGVVGILTSVAGGGFNPPRRLTLSGSIAYPTTADFNNDKRLDLLLVQSDRLIILLGTGDGTFGTPNSFVIAGSSNLGRPVVGDFNNDSRMDVVLPNLSATLFLPGDGTGKLGAPVVLLSNLNTSGLLAGDFNQDNKLDLAFLSPQSGASANGLNILLGNGFGQFSQTQSIALPAFTQQLASLDFNEDGWLDVLAIHRDAGLVSVLTGLGTGALRAPQTFVTGAVYEGVGVSDFDRDGRPDVALLSYYGGDFRVTAQVTLLRNEGLSFRAARANFVSEAVQTLVAGDFNNDGRADTAALQNGQLVIRLDGLNDTGARLALTEQPELTARDFNNDGRLDLLARSAQAVTILLGDGRGGFVNSGRREISSRTRGLDWGDFNRDGRLDLVALDGAGQPALYFNDGNAGLAAPVNFGVGLNLDFFAAGDFNGDGALDVAATTQVVCSTGNVLVRLYFNDGQGRLTTVQRVYLDTSPVAWRAEDFDGDGRSDLLLQGGCSSAGALTIAFAGPVGLFQQQVTQPFANSLVKVLNGDLNSDGRLDLILFVGNGFSSFSNISVQVMLGQSRGGFAPPIEVGTLPSLNDVVLSDFDGDGRPDLIGANRNISVLTLSLNRCGALRSLAFQSAASFSSVQFAPESIVAAYGTALATTVQSAVTLPLPTQLDGTSVQIQDSAGVMRTAQLYFVAPTQINFLLPAGLALGTARVSITNVNGTQLLGTVRLAPVAPGLFSANSNGQGVAAAVALRVRVDGSQSYEAVARFDAVTQRFVSVPLDLGPEGEQLFLILYGTGLRQRSGLATVIARLGGVETTVLYAGAQGDLAGLDQINLRLPRTLAGRGEVELQLNVEGQAANPVRVNLR